MGCVDSYREADYKELVCVIMKAEKPKSAVWASRDHLGESAAWMKSRTVCLRIPFTQAGPSFCSTLTDWVIWTVICFIQIQRFKC